MLVENCRVRNGDDCVPVFPPTSNLTVRNVSCECGNGVTIAVWPDLSVWGSGGDITNVVFDDIVCEGTNNCISLKSMPEFVGKVSNVTFSNILMTNVTTAVAFDMLAQGLEVGVGSTSSRVTIVNVTGTASEAGHFTCSPNKPCTDLRLINVHLTPRDKSDTLKYACVSAKGSYRDSSPVPCGWPEEGL